MDRDRLRGLLEAVASGTTGIDEALSTLNGLPFENLGFAHVDSHRALRTGFPEVVLCRGKTPSQVVHILERLAAQSAHVLATRATPETYAAVQEALPAAVYHPASGIITLGDEPTPKGTGTVLVITAGTSDLPVAEEAALTARWMGARVQTLVDVGVAGIHRLFHHREQIVSASVIVVVAGMEGALPSVVAGLVDRPVIAVPTSVGYGAHFNGLAPLLTMLNSCAAGLAVVNIDNGFGAGYLAALINRPA
ncbi:MAG: nickel pincer cofactor biosynthesis protein LarB [Candidatus Xenobia bacterium]